MKEYLPTLRPQSKWHTTKDPIMKGQVAWILENNSPRGLWPLGMVTEVYPGSDNIVRKCKLKTKTGETVKGAHQLCPLECNGNLRIICHVPLLLLSRLNKVIHQRQEFRSPFNVRSFQFSSTSIFKYNISHPWKCSKSESHHYF